MTLNARHLLPALLLLAAACDLRLEQLSFAPPGAVADLDPDCEEIVVSRGVALGVACTDSNGGGCENITVSVADPTIADARVAYSADFTSIYERRQATSFVVYDKRAGETAVTVDSSDGELTYAVTVLAP
jgi:hypothetical protein